MRLLTVGGHWRASLRTPRGRRELEAGLTAETPRRWVRLALFYGGAPGSHMAGRHWAAWRTRWGQLSGINVRCGWWPGPCVTLLAHTRPARPATAPAPLAPRSPGARMALYGPCPACGAARDIRTAASYGVPGKPGSAGVYDQLYCPACGRPG